MAAAQAVAAQARGALDNARLTGEPEAREAPGLPGLPGRAAPADQNVPPNQGFDMGQVWLLCPLV
jgi:hypothetical protein